MIIRGGENIAPEEVEAVLYEHSDVLDAAVVGLTDETWGERVVAAIVLREGGSLEDVQSHIKEHLAGFKRPRTSTSPRSCPGPRPASCCVGTSFPVLEDLGL